MGSSSLQDWLLDPLFAPAEDVQESADRLESNFRTWQQETLEKKRTELDMELQRIRLISACDTLRWQLEGFERAVNADASLHPIATLEESKRKRRQEFIYIIRLQLQQINFRVRTQSMMTGTIAEDVAKGSGEELMAVLPSAIGAALSPAIILPGETFVASRSPPEQLPAKPETLELRPQTGVDVIPRSASLSALSGFLGATGSEMTSDHLDVQPSANSCESDPHCSKTEMGVIKEFFSGDPEDLALPGPEAKAFPSLVQLGSNSRIQGWQCLLIWLHHFQRTVRRRKLEHAKSVGPHDNDASPACTVEDSAHCVVSARCEASHAFSVVRTLSSTNLASVEQPKWPEWQVDVPVAVGACDGEVSKKLNHWHLAARPRRTSTFSRPMRPHSPILLVCAAVLMIAVACYCTLSKSRGLNLRHVRLLEISDQAHSPAFP